jgi:glycolate oxidase iron-sulfur subunit
MTVEALSSQAACSAPAPARHSQLRDLDYSVVQQCMHCGLCLPTCPTYDATKLERNSPRGRISLMRSIADGRLEATPGFADEMYFCLGCLACMTACPAGVNYAELFEHARAEAEESGVLKSPKRSFIRWLTMRWLFMDLRRLRFLGALIRLYQQIGLMGLIRGSGVMKIMPRRLQELEAMTPKIQPKFSAQLIAEVTSPSDAKKYRVALLTGCAQDLMFSDVNRDTAEVLARNGCEVFTPASQSCCGSLHAHNGELEMARELARKNIDQFPPEQFDAIISNAAGCGSHLKHYSHLLAGDAAYRERAKAWDAKLKDIHEWLGKIGVTKPSANVARQTVTYHEACHLCHGQKITAQPRDLLRSIPNLTLVELPESTWCCGSAGIYNVIQPKMANDLLDRKLAHITSTGAPIAAVGNPGCLAHMANGIRRQNLPVRLVHPITLLAEAYRAR